MSSIQSFCSDFIFPGYNISEVNKEDDIVHIYLEPLDSGICKHCGGNNTYVHDYYAREIRDVDFFGMPLIVHLKIRRIVCKYCSHKGIEHISFLSKESHSRYTKRLRDAIINDCEQRTISDVAKAYHLSRPSIKDIHKEHLQASAAGTFNLGDTTLIGVDEFAIAKHHKYATVVADLETRRVLFVGLGKNIATLNEFFKLCGTEGCKQIKAVAMDQNASYETSVKNHCPNAKVVYDLFHLVSKFGLTVISQIRTRLADDYQKHGQRDMYFEIKGSRWILLGRQNNLNEAAKERLERVLQLNEPLAKAYMLKEQIRDLYFCSSLKEATRRWNLWRDMALESNVAEIMKFAQIQERRYKEGIINSSLFHIGTSIVEGINNKIKVIKRKAYGFRDFEYFALLIKNAFLGKSDIPRKST